MMLNNKHFGQCLHWWLYSKVTMSKLLLYFLLTGIKSSQRSHLGQYLESRSLKMGIQNGAQRCRFHVVSRSMCFVEHSIVCVVCVCMCNLWTTFCKHYYSTSCVPWQQHHYEAVQMNQTSIIALKGYSYILHITHIFQIFDFLPV